MTDEEKPKNRKCLHIEISTHPYKKDGWEMEIGHLTGRIGISTPEPDKKQILDEIARAMDGLKSEEHRLGGLQLHKKGGKQMKALDLYTKSEAILLFKRKSRA